MRTKVVSLVEDPSSYGKFNCVLFFEKVQSSLTMIHREIIKQFEPTEISMSMLNLDNFEMDPFDITLPFLDDNSIKKVLYVKNKEQIILEYFNGRIMIEHLFRFDELISEGAGILISKYANENIGSTLVLGFELSVNIDSFTDSVEELRKKMGLHPIIILSKKNHMFEREEYGLESSEINKQQARIINEYASKLDLKR